MTVSVSLAHQRFTIAQGSDRTYGSELWIIEGLTDWIDSNTTVAVLDRVPVALLAAHRDPGLAAAKCRIKRLEDHENLIDGTKTAWVSVQYDSAFSWRGGLRPRTMAIQDGGAFIVQAPVWRHLGTTPASYVLTEAPFERRRVNLIKSRVIAGELSIANLSIILENVGCPYYVDGGPIVWLLGTPRTVELSSNQTVIEFNFWTTTRVPAIPTGSPLGNSVAIPALNYLENWSSPPEGSNSTAPTIGIARVREQFPQGFNLPHLPEAVPADLS